MSEKHVLIGAHLERSDAEDVEGVALFDLGDVTLSAAPFDPRHGIADRQLVLRVAAIRAALAARETFIAIRYGVAVAGLEEARSKVASFVDGWRARLERNRGMVEMTMKIGTAGVQARPPRDGFDSGRAYLEALHKARSPRPVDPAFREAVDVIAGTYARDARWGHREDGGTEVAFLVPRSSVPAFAAAGEKLRADFPSVPFLLSGPWPLEVFAHD